ncbi:DUF4435 domain-containing protein [Methylobacterium goesingense]|uniref:DUF4435 domain-containing protein n=1 Tax=Methylobacterium goesingense TaxID=243690 RepID=A0ABV2LFK7_9HYPH|nr:DUF4435 domain-containing protein [Methylobacterium goesingense]GJD76586.1 hypothetical protein CFIICLFH_4844 [Methylobacterium goesingense]
MTSPEALREGRNSYAVALHGLLRDFEKDAAQVFVLLEGKDADYYRLRISAVCVGNNIKLSYRNLKGKKNEKSLIKAMKGNKTCERMRYMAFFDRDYEDDIAEIEQPENYVTPTYAIENLYTGVDSVAEMIHALLFSDAVHDDDDVKIIEDLIRDYQELQEKFHQAVSLFNHWGWVQRHMPRPGSLDLDKFDFDIHCESDFDSKTIVPRYTLSDLNDLAKDRSPVTAGEIAVASAWFQTRAAKSSYRGKQEVSFLYWFLQNLISKGTAAQKPFSKKMPCSKRVSKKELISELTNYAETPPELMDFIRRRRDVFLQGTSTTAT